MASRLWAVLYTHRLWPCVNKSWRSSARLKFAVAYGRSVLPTYLLVCSWSRNLSYFKVSYAVVLARSVTMSARRPWGYRHPPSVSLQPCRAVEGAFMLFYFQAICSRTYLLRCAPSLRPPWSCPFMLTRCWCVHVNKAKLYFHILDVVVVSSLSSEYDCCIWAAVVQAIIYRL